MDDGVSRELASDRSARLSDLRYALRFVLPAETTSPIRGHARIDLTLHDLSSDLVVDFAPGDGGRVDACVVNGLAIVPAQRNGHLVLPADALRRGRNVLSLDFLAGDGPLNRRDGYLYTVFVPARAREAFPCFDQPDLKARWNLVLDLPPHWRATANAAIVSNGGAVDEARRPDSNRSIVSFAETGLLPTYLFAFAAGIFDLEHREHRRRLLSVYHRVDDRELLMANLDAIVDAHVCALEWLEAYTSIPYPFGKLDIVLIPDFQFGGMEHPGAIVYNQSSLLLHSSATRHQQLARAHLLAHETAHMWFGDLVTMRWFDDVWMKEVCANFMAAKVVNPQFPDLDHDLRFLHDHYPAAYDVDRTAGATPIRQPLDNLRDAASLYGAIVYLKSPIVLRQLEIMLGEDMLRAALREYLLTFAFGSASWSDLLAILSRYSSIDLAGWSREWIEEAGRPRIDVRVGASAGGPVQVRLQTVDPQAGRDLKWPQPLDLAIGRSSTIEHVRIWLDGANGPFEWAAARPDFVLPNGRGLAYGEFRLDGQSREWLLGHLPSVGDGLTRGSAWLTLWDAMLGRTLTPDALFALALRMLASETSELNLQRILADVQRLFWVFQPADERAAHAETLETALRALLDRVPTRTARAAVFAACRGVATTPAAVDWLQALWRGDAEVPGLALVDTDRIELAKELAIRSTTSLSRTLIERQCERTPDADRRNALVFIADALSASEEERQRFVTRMSRPENRRREPWVIEGARWLHHPLRGGHAVTLIAPGLALLDDMQRTGDVFLPKRWVDAMLAGHGSNAAAKAVRRFLDEAGHDYPAALRRMILASADHLFRRHLLHT